MMPWSVQSFFQRQNAAEFAKMGMIKNKPWVRKSNDFLTEVFT